MEAHEIKLLQSISTPYRELSVCKHVLGTECRVSQAVLSLVSPDFTLPLTCLK